MLKCCLPIPIIILILTSTNSRNSSAELKLVELGVGLPWNPWVDPLRVVSVTAHHNCLAVAYRHFVAIYKLKVLFSCTKKLFIVSAWVYYFKNYPRGVGMQKWTSINFFPTFMFPNSAMKPLKNIVDLYRKNMIFGGDWGDF